MKIVSGVGKPLVQGATVSAADLEYNSTKVVNASQSLFFESIPFEMLRTHETKPQVIVQVGDFPAVCKNLTCHFNYTVPEGNVTGFTYTAASKQLQLQGVGLPANASLIRHVEFAHSLCTVSQADNASLTCTLDHEPVCGSHLPKLVAKRGLVNNSASLVAETITCTVASVNPTT